VSIASDASSPLRLRGPRQLPINDGWAIRSYGLQSILSPHAFGTNISPGRWGLATTRWRTGSRLVERPKTRREDPSGLSETEREELPGCARRTSSCARTARSSEGGHLFRPGDAALSRFRFVHDHRDTYQVKRLCELDSTEWQKQLPQRTTRNLMTSFTS
jgi:hypothetical protein